MSKTAMSARTIQMDTNFTTDIYVKVVESRNLEKVLSNQLGFKANDYAYSILLKKW